METKSDKTPPQENRLDISIRPLRKADLEDAEQIFRLAFGTYLGVPDPAKFSKDRVFIRTRWRAKNTAAFGAEVDGRLVGSNIATRWGSLGFFGPLTVRPEFWDRGVGKLLTEPVVDTFDRWGCTHTGLYTFSESQKHIGLYQRFGFWPRFLTPIMSKPVQPGENMPQCSKYSLIPKRDKKTCLKACFEMTNLIFEGLDLEQEITAVNDQGLGDTVIIRDGNEPAGLAVCHLGPETEAGQDSCYVKFGAVRPGKNSGELFNRLLNACEALAAEKGMKRLVAGVNTARHRAYQRMLEQGFSVDMIGIIMQRPNEAAYNRPDIYLLDDWR